MTDDTKKAEQQLEAENKLMAEHLNQLSEILTGNRESDYFTMVTAATHLKLKSQNVEIQNNYREIADAISALKQLSDDIMSDA